MKSVLRYIRSNPWSVAVEALSLSLTAGSMLWAVVHSDPPWHCALLGTGFGFAVGTIWMGNMWRAKFDRINSEMRRHYETAARMAQKLSDATIDTETTAH